MNAPFSAPRKPSRIAALCRSAAISEANRARAAHNGGTKWSAVEMKIVLDLYPDYEAIQQRLPKRTYSQIRQFAKCYGIASKRHVWTNKEEAALRAAVKEAASGADIYRHFPGFTKPQVRQKASALRLKWPRPGPAVLGVPILDAVRAEASRRNLSLIDLDAICGGAAYWAKCNKKINWRKVVAATSYMGGAIGVTWADEP